MNRPARVPAGSLAPDSIAVSTPPGVQMFHALEQAKRLAASGDPAARRFVARHGRAVTGLRDGAEARRAVVVLALESAHDPGDEPGFQERRKRLARRATKRALSGQPAMTDAQITVHLFGVRVGIAASVIGYWLPEALLPAEVLSEAVRQWPMQVRKGPAMHKLAACLDCDMKDLMAKLRALKKAKRDSGTTALLAIMRSP